MFTHSARVNLTHSYISHIIENSDHFRIKYGFICDYAPRTRKSCCMDVRCRVRSALNVVDYIHVHLQPSFVLDKPYLRIRVCARLVFERLPILL